MTENPKSEVNRRTFVTIAELLSVHSPQAAHNLQQHDGGTLVVNSKDLRVELLQSVLFETWVYGWTRSRLPQ